MPDVYEVGWKEYAKAPVRPFFLGESTYEGEHGAWGSGHQARKQAYWAVLSGGFGNAYGSPNWNIPANWRNVLKLPGAESLKNFREIFESRAWWNLVPDMKNEFVTAGHGTMATNDLAVAALANDGSFGIVYSPSRRKLTVNLAKMRAPVRVVWIDPVSGSISNPAGTPVSNRGSQDFTSPEKNSGGATDWVLALESR
jgi:hypothetical protein